MIVPATPRRGSCDDSPLGSSTGSRLKVSAGPKENPIRDARWPTPRGYGRDRRDAAGMSRIAVLSRTSASCEPASAYHARGSMGRSRCRSTTLSGTPDTPCIDGASALSSGAFRVALIMDAAVRKTGDGTVPEFADSGIGILSKIWIARPVSRDDTARKSGGNGLGLSLVKAVVDRHEAPHYPRYALLRLPFRGLRNRRGLCHGYRRCLVAAF